MNRTTAPPGNSNNAVIIATNTKAAENNPSRTAHAHSPPVVASSGVAVVSNLA